MTDTSSGSERAERALAVAVRGEAPRFVGRCSRAQQPVHLGALLHDEPRPLDRHDPPLRQVDARAPEMSGVLVATP